MRIPIDKSFLRFLVVGVINFSIGSMIMFGSYNICGFGYWASSVAAYAVATPVSFFLNKKYTFRNNSACAGQILKFAIHILACCAIAFGAAKFAIDMLFHSLSTSLSGNIALGLGLCFFVLMNYFGQKLFVFEYHSA